MNATYHIGVKTGANAKSNFRFIKLHDTIVQHINTSKDDRPPRGAMRAIAKRKFFLTSVPNKATSFDDPTSAILFINKLKQHKELLSDLKVLKKELLVIKSIIHYEIL